MTAHLIYFSKQFDCPDAESKPWEAALTDRSIVIHKDNDENRIAFYLSQYAPVAILIETDDESLAALKSIGATNESSPLPPHFPVIGIVDGSQEASDLTSFVEAGLTAIWQTDSPVELLLSQIQTFAHLADLRTFEQAASDIKSLSDQTRQLLHDTIQPLTTLQARLQLLSAKAGADDPDKDKKKQMVDLVIATTVKIKELQDLHQRFS